MDRKLKLYKLVVAAGGVIESQAEWRALGQAAGYTGRSDLAGYYGGQWPSMDRDGDRRVLTPTGRSRARRVGIRLAGSVGPPRKTRSAARSAPRAVGLRPEIFGTASHVRD